MKYSYKVLAYFFITLLLGFLSSCATTTPNFNRALADQPSDISSYADYIIEDCKLPDGKVTTIYVFNNANDSVLWFQAQGRKFDPDWQKTRNQQIAKLENEKGGDVISKPFDAYRDQQIAMLKWEPTGPLSPFWKLYCSLKVKYGERTITNLLMNEQSPISYYNAEELGKLANCMTETSGASACYEDENGAYLISILPPRNLKRLTNNKAEQKKHVGQLGYEAFYIPKKMYANIEPPKLKPAKITPFDPNNIPDSDRNLIPVANAENGAYYYDVNLANQLQWLAVKIACKGVYDMAYTGDFRAKNPIDYYKTSFIKNYLASNNGNVSKGTTLFEGICFDYADFAYQELKENKSSYSNVTRFWMVSTFDNPTDIIAYRIAEKGEVSNFIINNTPVVIFSHNHIKAHGGATSHSWFWVQSKDGTVYWVDPTWTDNSGKPVYGIIRNGEELQLTPDSSLCVK